jgi:hypothetical protein
MTKEDLAHIQSLLGQAHLHNAVELIGFIAVTIQAPFETLSKQAAAAKILDYGDETKESGPLLLEVVAAWVDEPEKLIPVLQRTQKQSLIPALDTFLLGQLQEGERPGMVLNRTIQRHLPQSTAFLRERSLDQQLPRPTPKAGRLRF